MDSDSVPDDRYKGAKHILLGAIEQYIVDLETRKYLLDKTTFCAENPEISTDSHLSEKSSSNCRMVRPERLALL